jgi:AraC-like DNA-binding protein
MVAPLVAGTVYAIVVRSDDILSALQVYLLLLGIGLIIYMVREVRHYGRWLRDNYADLEHKEVRQSFMALTIILLVFFVYASGFGGDAYEYIVQLCGIFLICYLLWRVETLSDLTIPKYKPTPIDVDSISADDMENDEASQMARDNTIRPLLQRYCIEAQLYLQHDLTLSQLAQAVGTNRFYLSRYFSHQGITYNAYINDLRINHFVSHYRDAVNAQESFTAQQLASDSGYRSYSTFSLAFKQRMGKTVKAWMSEIV